MPGASARLGPLLTLRPGPSGVSGTSGAGLLILVASNGAFDAPGS